MSGEKRKQMKGGNFNNQRECTSCTRKIKTYIPALIFITFHLHGGKTTE